MMRKRIEMIAFNKELAQQVEKELRDRYPNNQWPDGYITEVIKLCCRGNGYFFGHHGAFDAYLDHLGLWRIDCPGCGETIFPKKGIEFCSSICEDDYYSAQGD
jgi:hypothetical protein